jgi:hypothetical protein
MEGYSHVFNSSIGKFNTISDKKLLFSSFRAERAIYGFTENMDVPPDQEAVSIALKMNPEMYNKYLSLLAGRKAVGYNGSSSVHSSYNNLDSRHIMMSVFLFTKIPEPVSTIVEIGGGYGNWFLLNRNMPFTSWKTIDLPHVGELQKWYLSQTDVDTTRWSCVSAFDYPDVVEPIDLVLGTHSLSEFSFTIFNEYFQRVLMHTKYFLYCHHNTLPDPHLLAAKQVLINSQFTLIDSFTSEHGNVTNSLYIKK